MKLMIVESPGKLKKIQSAAEQAAAGCGGFGNVRIFNRQLHYNIQ